MTRSVSEILEDIDDFAPLNGNWRRLDDLLDELWQSGVPRSAIPVLFRVFERFPNDDGAGALWSIVHGVEYLDDYETELCDSLSRRSSFMGNVMLKRLQKSRSI